MDSTYGRSDELDIAPAVPSDDAARAASTGCVKVWDLPTRLFHWSLVLSCTGAVVTAQIGGNWMEWHLPLGIATVGLLAFRILWGIVGPRYARFTSFPVSPRSLLGYLRGMRAGGRHAGHSPTGAIAVFVLLGLLLVQGVSGLFSSDSIVTEGPLVRYASEATVSLASWLHVRLQWALYAMVGLHVIAVFAYLLFKKDNLIVPMLTGWKKGLRAEHAADGLVVRLVGLLLVCSTVGLALWWLR